ncbi:PspC domain-containing protein [Pseudomarimonas arenosa]|uniref:PspC domain-containing protein n=1 Tax=Pseudomarimonas arenosa TaxID=2774145 RepID=A0AAW3ZHD5_9GAMM|nr:PspC domain-containing protein [Pseudomarimonas arenosa]MBD8525436.1 PspC domain-containing protein [Pseudomarimonas arenosa]
MSGRLTRSRNRWLLGVCGGLAEYLGWSPNATRLVYVVLSIASAAFPGILVYLLLWLLMPAAPRR